jgi:serine/threonine-protein kinase
VRALLTRCLEKDAKRRLRDIGDARIELEDVIAARQSASGAMRVAVPATARAGTRPWAAVAITAVAVAAVAWLAPRFFVRAAPPPPARFEVAAPRGKLMPPDGAAIAISPDGRSLAMSVADTAGTQSLWVRRLDELAPRRLAGTDGVRLMFWSPDSRWLGFFANDEVLSKIAVDAGSPERICETRAARGGSWGKDGTILLAPFSNGGIFRVPAAGGTPMQLTHPDSAHGVTGHRFPVWLPDGKHFLFVTVPAGADGKGGLCVGSVDGGAAREIGRAETGVSWADPHWLLGTRSAALVAQRFDTGALKLEGDPVVIGDPLTGSQFAGAPVVSVSRGGTLAFLTRETRRCA